MSRACPTAPPSPIAYIMMKVITSLVLGAASVAAVFVAGLVTHKVDMPGSFWLISALCVWIGSLLFAAFGLLLGHLLPTENVMQFLGLILTPLAFAGGLFVPLSQFLSVVQTIAKFTPLYGLNQLVHTPLLGNGVDWTWAVNVLAWLFVFIAGAAWRFRRDTARGVTIGRAWIRSARR
jgi:ABC-2 type transport system permease protein